MNKRKPKLKKFPKHITVTIDTPADGEPYYLVVAQEELNLDGDDVATYELVSVGKLKVTKTLHTTWSKP